jgi:hypothetical protein
VPYIKPKQRPPIDKALDAIKINDAGDLNYAMTRLCHKFIEMRGLKYETLALVTGVVQNVNQELYRRVAGPYEDAKAKENGDILPSTCLPTGHSIPKARP